MQVSEAISFAEGVHRNEVRKRYRGGTRLPYITHCLEVMKKVWVWGAGTEEMLIVSVLHDVKESLADQRQEPVDMIDLPSPIDEILDELTFIPGADPKAEKEVYMASFGQKSIQALVVKLADRICNTLDFYLTDPAYARRYFEKAKGLQQALSDRYEEISEVFGATVTNEIAFDWQNTLKIIHAN